MLTREQYKKHVNAIKWFYEYTEDTKMWVRHENGKEWILSDKLNWLIDYVYVIDDTYSELRKAIADGKEIEYKINNRWRKLKVKYPNMEFVLSSDDYRIKSKIKFPIFKKNDFIIVKFNKKDVCEVVFIINEEKASFIGDIYIGKILPININDEKFEDVLYDEEMEMWHGHPIYYWNNSMLTGRYVGFYDAKNKTLFHCNSERNGCSFDNCKPYPHLDESWIIEAYKKLDFESY